MHPYDSLSGLSPLLSSLSLAQQQLDATSAPVADAGPQPHDSEYRILGFDTQSLSDILSPKVALCDKKFLLTVDDVTFIGHPTLLNADRPGTGHRFARMIQRKRLADQQQVLRVSSAAAGDGWGGGLVGGGVTPLKGSVAIPDLEESYSEHMTVKDVRTPTAMPAVGAGDHHLTTSSAEPANTTASSQPAITPTATPQLQPSAPSSRPSGGTMSHSQISTGSQPHFRLNDHEKQQHHHLQQQQQLTMFNLVIALRNENGKCVADADWIYENVIAKLTAGLKYEQLKRGYIKREAELILSIRDEVQSSGRNGWSKEVMNRMLAESSLARLLAHTYHSIRADSVCHVVINSSIDLSMQLPRLRLTSQLTQGAALLPSHRGNDRGGAGAGGTGGKDEGDDGGSGGLAGVGGGSNSSIARGGGRSGSGIYPDPAILELRPYHALLLMHDPEEILRHMLPIDASPLLAELIEVVTPTQSLEELSMILNCSSSQLYRLAAHLVYWRMAKIVDVITTRNVYVMSRDLDPSALKSLEIDFNSRIPALNFFETLSSLSSPKPYQSTFAYKESRTSYLEVIAFFLRNDLIRHLRIVVYIVVSKHTRRTEDQAIVEGIGGGAVEGSSLHETGASMYSNDNDFVVVNDATMGSEKFMEWINVIALRQPPSISQLFLRVAPYFNGRFHLEEIMFRESVTRKDLKSVLRYQEYVITSFSGPL